MRVRPFLLLLLMLLIAGCSEMKGLQELTGENVDSAGASGNPGGLVQEFELVMADKSDNTDQSLLQAANRIEDASMEGSTIPLVDVIEIRQNTEADEIYVAMLYRDVIRAINTFEEEVAIQNRLRLVVESAWIALRLESEGFDNLRIVLLSPERITTFDNMGQSTTALVLLDIIISRDDAYAYLSGERSLDKYMGLFAEGKLVRQGIPGDTRTYMGHPNHPFISVPGQISEEGEF
jgi:hypothetical protein